jgi:hypothetical protein
MSRPTSSPAPPTELAQTPSSVAEPTGEPAASEERVDALLDRVAARGTPKAAEADAAAAAARALATLRTVTAMPLALAEGRVRVTLRGAGELEVPLAPEVDEAVVALAIEQRQAVLVEHHDGRDPLCVGAVLTRWPEHLRLRAREVTIEADDQIALRSGQAALRLRGDGDVELLGTRVAQVSRGLFRLVGRVLRLN